MTMLLRLSGLLAFVLAAAGCGGGSGTTPGGPAPAPTTAPKPPAETASVTFSIAVPSRVMSVQRQPRYVSPGTATVQVAVNGGAPQSFSVSGGTPCSSTTQPPSSGTCVVASVQAPPGNDTFTVTLLDGAGRTLSAGTVQQTIVANQTNTVNITFDGVVAALRVSLTNAAPAAGSPARIGVVLTPLDAAGYTIVGAAGALPSVTLTDGDTSGATGLYLAGSGDCAVPGATPLSSIVVTGSTPRAFGVSFYADACLYYGGQPLPNGATITASIASGPSASTKLTPAALPASAGAWAIGEVPSNNFAFVLDHFGPNQAVLATISGANTHVDGAYGLAVDAGGGVWIASDLHFNPVASPTDGTWDGYLYMFPPSASGNAAPSSSTHFTGIPAQILYDRQTGQFPDVLKYLAFDGAGNAFLMKYNSPLHRCEIWRVPLTGGTVAAVKAEDCGDLTVGVFQPPFGDPYGMVSDRGYLYAGVPANLYFEGARVMRYTIGGGGTLTRNAAAYISNASPLSMNVDAAGNLLLSATTWMQPASNAGRYPAADFVSGQTTVIELPTDILPGTPPITQDAAGNTYSAVTDFLRLFIAPAKP
jgi:hypothetical protein